MTSYLLYTIAKLGFKVDIMQYGMNVIMDTVNFAVEMEASAGDAEEDVADISSGAVDYMEG